MPRCWGPRSGHSPVSRHDDERLADLPARLGALLALVGAGPVERASETDRVAVEVGLAEGAELAPSGTGQDGQGQEHPPALIPLGGGGQQAAHLVVGGHPELGALEPGGPGTFGRVAVEPAPAHRLAEGSGQHGVVPSDACCLEGPASALSGGKFAVPLVEVTGIQIDDPPVAELGVDHRLGRAPGVVKGPRGTSPSRAVAEPLFDQGAYGGIARSHRLAVGEFLLPLARLALRLRLVPRSDEPADLAGPPGLRVRPDEDPQLPFTLAELSNRSCTLGTSPSLGRVFHSGRHGPDIGQRGKERCESGRIGLTANPLRTGLRREVVDSQGPHQA